MFDVFIGSSTEGRPYAQMLVEKLADSGLFRPMPWWDSFEYGSSFLESLFGVFGEVDFAVFVATPDDILISRGEQSAAARDNVLFEYALFAGHLGRKNSVLLEIGDQRLPSDLKGIVTIRVSTSELERSMSEAVDSLMGRLLDTRNEVRAWDFPSFRNPESAMDDNCKKKLLSALSAQRAVQLRRRSGDIAAPGQLARVLEKLIREKPTKVGLGKKQTVVDGYVELSEANEVDIRLMESAFAGYVAKKILLNFGEIDIPTRMAVHLKKNQHAEMSFLSNISRSLSSRPAIVDLSYGRAGGVKVLGNFLNGESAVFVQDFTTTATIPAQCIAELRAKGVEVVALFSFVAHLEHKTEIEENCRSANVSFFPFAFLTPEQSVELVGG